MLNDQMQIKQEIQITVSERNLKSALKSYVNGTARRGDNPLERLAIVERVVSDPDFPPYIDSRTFALSKILFILITDEYTRNRLSIDLNIDIANNTRDAALREVRQDSKSGNLKLIGWSWLYHYYVRAELGITSKIFCQTCCIHGRTLRRYQDYTLKQLTNLLIDEEWQLRR